MSDVVCDSSAIVDQILVVPDHHQNPPVLVQAMLCLGVASDIPGHLGGPVVLVRLRPTIMLLAAMPGAAAYLDGFQRRALLPCIRRQLCCLNDHGKGFAD